MVYGVKYLVSYLSQFMTLHPGDIISTGTPPGVGMGMKPPRYLKAGDVVELGIDGLGTQQQTSVADGLTGWFLRNPDETSVPVNYFFAIHCLCRISL